MPLPRSHCQLLLLVPSICPISVSSPNPRWNAPGSLGVSNRLSFVFVSIVLYIPALFSIWNTFSHSMIISYGSFNLVPVSCSLPDPFSQNYFLPTLTSQRFHSIPFLGTMQSTENKQMHLLKYILLIRLQFELKL